MKLFGERTTMISLHEFHPSLQFLGPKVRWETAVLYTTSTVLRNQKRWSSRVVSSRRSPFEFHFISRVTTFLFRGSVREVA